MTDLKQTFSKRLKKAFEVSKEWNQTKTADHFGVSRNTVNSWAAGTNWPGFQVIQELAEMLEVEPEWLFGANPVDLDYDALLVKGIELLRSIESKEGLEQALEYLEVISKSNKNSSKKTKKKKI